MVEQRQPHPRETLVQVVATREHQALQSPGSIVADAVGQNAEYLEHGVSGLLVPPGGNAAFASAVADLLDDPARRTELGETAARRAWSCFTWDQLVERAEQAYDGALARRISSGRRPVGVTR